eukprot:TRINITY_DN18672_c0_g1_i1.p1 TRINITY_DN18672_c0_g1~~TRINITY_DN18672_c0_g1_i1.p1  ORF type:complete len:199 (-),score=33.90 TRINITY_DN18672_c0_g1_i1:70-642(-)
MRLNFQLLLLILSCFGKSGSIKVAGDVCPPDSHQRQPIPVPRGGLPFCSHYADTACCDAKDTLAIRKTVNQLMRPECPNCYAMVREWKCAECSPKAEMFYGSDGSCARNTRLRLCADYCHTIFDVCKDIPFDKGHPNGAFYLNDPPDLTAEEWCEQYVAADPNCFRGAMPSERDETCKCPSHACGKHDEL